MMIIEFKVDENVLAEDRRHNPAATDPGVLEVTYFTMPVRLCVDSKELLQTPNSAWVAQPLLGFATHLAYSLSTLHSTGIAICSVAEWGTLSFQQRGECIRVRCDFNRVEADVPIDELDRTIQDFRKRVGDWFRLRAPELMAHSSWATWFPGS
jgi:hypothetical protein